MATYLVKQSNKGLKTPVNSKMDDTLYTALKPLMVGDVKVYKQPATGGSGGTLKVVPATGLADLTLSLSVKEANGYIESCGIYLPHNELSLTELSDATKVHLTANFVTIQKPTSVGIKDKTILR
jgi:hypothetical protein